MKPEEQKARRKAHVEEFNRQNKARPSRLGIIKPGDRMEDYWLEDGLPFAAIGLETEGDGAPVVEIMLGAEGEAGRSVTHTVARVNTVTLRLTDDGSDDGLDVEDAEGATTLLRFEPSPQG